MDRGRSVVGGQQILSIGEPEGGTPEEGSPRGLRVCPGERKRRRLVKGKERDRES